MKCSSKSNVRDFSCRGVTLTRPARGSKLTLLYSFDFRFARTVDGCHPSKFNFGFARCVAASTKSHASGKIKIHYFRILRICRLITYWPARSIFISGAGPEFRRNSRRASPVNWRMGSDEFFDADSKSPHMT